MTKLKKSIAAKLYRGECPDPVVLGEYHLDMLPPPEARRIRDHLKSCPLCAQEVAGLRDFLEAVDAEGEPTLSERIQTWVARLLPERAAGRAPGLAFATRGDESQVLVYRAGDACLNIEIQSDPQQPDRRTLLGLLIGVGTRGVRAALLQDAREVASAELDELGNVVLPAVAPGVYSFILRGPAFEIVIERLEIPDKNPPAH